MSIPDIDKIRVLLPHWLEHNQSHRAEFGRWAEVARGAGLAEVAELIEQHVGDHGDDELHFGTKEGEAYGVTKSEGDSRGT